MSLQKHFFILFFLLPLTSRAYLWDIVPATSAPIVDFHFFDADTGIAVGYDVVMHTVDGGRNWTCDTLDSPTGGALELEHLRFVDRSHGFAAPDRRYLWKTSDAGRTWEKFERPTFERIRGLNFANKDSGLIVQLEGIEVTHDGGGTWRFLEYPGSFLSGCHILSQTEWFAFGGYNLLLLSRDAGVTWDTLQTPDRTGKYSNISLGHFSDTLNGVIHYFNTSDVALTEDGGKTWETVNCGGPLEEWQVIATDTIIGIDRKQIPRIIVVSTDRGKSWTEVPLDEVYATPQNIMMIDGSVGYAVDKYQRALYRTSDGWNSTERLDNKTGGIFRSIAFGDSLHGIAITGYSGKYTLDGGETWIPCEGLKGRGFSALYFTSSRRAVVLDPLRSLLVTEDAGVNWHTLVPCDFKTVHQFSKDTLFAHNSEFVSRSIDGGATWERFGPEENLGNLYDLAAGSSRRVFVIHRPDDMPRRLSYLTEARETGLLREFETSEHVRSLCAPDTANLAFSLDAGLFVRSTDGGATWMDTEFRDREEPYVMKFISPQRGWGSNYQTMTWTFDGGERWFSEKYDTRSEIRSRVFGSEYPSQIFVANKNLVWFAPWGDGLMVYRRSLSITSPDTVFQNLGITVKGSADGISEGLACLLVSPNDTSREIGRTEFTDSRDFEFDASAPHTPGTYRIVVRSLADTSFLEERPLIVKAKAPTTYNDCLGDTVTVAANSTRRVLLDSCFSDPDGESIVFSAGGAQWATVLDGGVLQLSPSEQDSTRRIDITATDISGNTTTVSFLALIDYSASVIPGAVLSYSPPRILGFGESNNAIALGLTQKQKRTVHVRIYGITGRRIAEKRFAAGPGVSTRRIELGRVRADGAFLVEVSDGASVVRKTILKAN